MDFEECVAKRYKNKIQNDKDRVDRTGHKIEFLLSYEEFYELLLPYKDDNRLYNYTDTGNYLCISRIDDIGDYILENVFVSTMSVNSKERNINNPVDGKISAENINNWQVNNKEDFQNHISYTHDIIKELYPNGTFYGKKHRAESIEKQKHIFKNICHQQAENNSQFGTCWIYSLELKINKKIPITNITKYESEGWVKGRKMVFH